MHLILTLDDGNGMMFNRRRQSRDRVMMERMAALTAHAKWFMSPYTAKLFADGLPANAVVSEDPLAHAGKGDFCFVEDADPALFAERIETIYVYRWNRAYPADRVLTLDLSCRAMTVLEEFPGSSHDKITLERYDL